MRIHVRVSLKRVSALLNDVCLYPKARIKIQFGSPQNKNPESV